MKNDQRERIKAVVAAHSNSRCLRLDWVTRIDPATARVLASWGAGDRGDRELRLSGVERLDHATARELANWGQGDCSWRLLVLGVVELELQVAGQLATWGVGRRVHRPRDVPVDELQDDRCLCLDNLTSLSAETAHALAGFGRGEAGRYELSLAGMRELDEDAAVALAAWGHGEVGTRWLQLNGIHRLETPAAAALSRFGAYDHAARNLSMEGLSEVEPGALRALAIWDSHPRHDLYVTDDIHHQARLELVRSPVQRPAAAPSLTATAELTGVGDGVYSVCFSQSGSAGLAGFANGELGVWHIDQDGRCKRIPPFAAHDDALSTIAAPSIGNLILTGSWDSTVKLWRWPWGIHRAPTAQATIDTGAMVSSVSSSPDGKWALIGVGPIAQLWELDGHNPKLRNTLVGHDADVNAVAIAADGIHMATGSSDNTARVWRRTGTDVEHVATLEGHASAVISVVFSPDLAWVATGSDDCTARVWTLRRGNVVADNTLEAANGAVTCLAVTADARRVLVASSSGAVTLLAVDAHRKPKPLATLDGHDSAVTAAAFSPSGRWALSADDDGTVRVWNVATH